MMKVLAMLMVRVWGNVAIVMICRRTVSGGVGVKITVKVGAMRRLGLWLGLGLH